MLRPLTLPLSKLMRLDEELCAVFILSNIGGYPVGAKLLSGLVCSGKLSCTNAGRMLCFCYGSGPSFIISIVGQKVFGSAKAGLLIFASCFLTSLIIGIAVSRCGERIQLSTSDTRYDLSSGCFVSSVISAARVMFTVCTMIVCFSAITAIIELSRIVSAAESLFTMLGANVNSTYIFPTLLEISHIQQIIPSSGSIGALCSALLSFGGICVILQVCAITHNIPLKPFLISRIPAMLISAALSAMISPCCEVIKNVTYLPTSAELQAGLFSVNASMSLCVLIMCGILLSTTSPQK